MTARDFLLNIVQELPSRGVDNTDIYISCLNGEEDPDSYKIVEISNDGSNDGVFIYIKKM